MTDYIGRERRAVVPLTDDQLEAIADRAAEKALEKVYAQVGKGLLHKLFWIIGTCTIAALMWMGGKGLPLK